MKKANLMKSRIMIDSLKNSLRLLRKEMLVLSYMLAMRNLDISQEM